MTINILFTCAGRRNYLINYFKEALGERGKIFAADVSASAPAMVDADIALLVPSVQDENYIPTLKKIIKIHQIKAIISLNDYELPILSKHKSELESLGTKVIVSDENVIDIAFDKIKTFEFLKRINVNTPKTFTTIKAAKEALEKSEIKFPLVVKPRWGSASTGIEFPENMQELELVFKLSQLKLKKSFLDIPSQQDFENAILIQEKMDGKEYGMDILNDFEGNYIGTFVREKLSMRSGETDKAISIINEKFDIVGRKISAELGHMGSLDCDVFEMQDQLYVLELNPRFGGGYPFSHEAGINTAAIYIEWLIGNKNISVFNTYKSGMAFSKCDRMMKMPLT